MTDKMSFIEHDSSFQDVKNILILKYLNFFNLKKWETRINQHYDWQDKHLVVEHQRPNTD